MIHTRLTKTLLLCALAGLLTMGTTACNDDILAAADETVALPDTQDTDVSVEETGARTRPEGWGQETHSDAADPNYAVVFPEDKVNQITIEPEDWEAMQANMVALFGEPGSGGDGGGFPGGPPQPGEEGFAGAPPRRGDGGFPDGLETGEGDPPQPGEQGFPQDFEPPEGAGGPALPEGAPGGGRFGGGGLGGGDMTSENPMWLPATITFEGDTWTHVGVRFKGNSSLSSGWRSGSLKLPLKLDFDEFEDEYPEIDDQRFYGFKQLSLANGFSDTSFLRDAAASGILADAGKPASKTAYYEVILDYGEGPVSLGLYTMIEVIDDTVVPRYFGSDDGNIYEGDGPAASFAASTYDQIEESFLKENNEEEADWSDIQALFDRLHSEQRTSDPAAWRANLESVFDVDAFLEWLAISAVIQHWDAYGAMNHNYYLYNDPDTGRLTWISWDHNMAMSAGMGGGAGRGPGNTNVSLDKADVGDSWPLIRYLLDDPVYYARYVDYLAQTVEGPFNPDHMAETYRTLAELIAPYASTEVGEAEFDGAVQQLIDHAYERAEVVAAFVSAAGR